MKIRRNCLSVGVVVLGLALAGAVVNCAGEVWAAASTLTLSIDDATVDMNIAPLNDNGSFNKSSASTISASTNNATGYTLTISAPDNAGSNYDKLVNTDNIACDNAGSNTNSNSGNISTNCLNSLKIATPEAQFKALNGTGYNGLWGYLPSKYNSSANTDFLPAPTITGDVIDKTTTANTVANTYTVAVGARVDSTMKTGSYSNTFVVKLVAEAVPYSIIYDDNVVSNMPMDVDSTTPDNTVSVASNTPTRSGYKFLGWCTVIPTNTAGVDACTGGTQYQPNASLSIDHVTTSNNNYHLYAMWQELIMQAFSASDCSAMFVGDTMVAKDSRDSTLYTIGKLADSNCWMLDNLALDLTDSGIRNSLSSANTNIDENNESAILTSLKDGNRAAGNQYATAGLTVWDSNSTANSYSVPKVNMASKDVVPQGNSDPLKAETLAGNWKVGGYYNYCAASAGSYCYGQDTSAGTSSDNATSDICPKGWRMPTGNTSGEYQALYNNANYNTYNNYRLALHLPLSGYFNNGSAINQGSYGVFWSSTRYDNYDMYYLYLDTSSVYPSLDNYRYGGGSVRCVLGS